MPIPTTDEQNFLESALDSLKNYTQNSKTLPPPQPLNFIFGTKVYDNMIIDGSPRHSSTGNLVVNTLTMQNAGTLVVGDINTDSRNTNLIIDHKGSVEDGKPSLNCKNLLG